MPPQKPDPAKAVIQHGRRDHGRMITRSTHAPPPSLGESPPASGTSSSSHQASRTRAYTNANHLVNFQYEPRGRGPRTGRSGRIGWGRGQKGPAGGSRFAKYDKDKFLQANFRFLVADTVDVDSYLVDPDRMFDWEDVVQVQMLSSIPIQCPISLESPPICPQITPCGHIYSFHSVMQHLVRHGGEELKRAAPCPLCYAPIVARELRLVNVQQVNPPTVGEAMTFRLLQRPKGSIIPVPVGSAIHGSIPQGAPPRRHRHKKGDKAQEDHKDEINTLLVNPYAKFAIANNRLANQLWRQSISELAALGAKVTVEGGMEADVEMPFIYAAMEALAHRARRWTQHRAEILEERGPACEGSSAFDLGVLVEEEIKKVYHSTFMEVTQALDTRSLHNATKEEFPALGGPQTAPSANKSLKTIRNSKESPSTPGDPFYVPATAPAPSVSNPQSTSQTLSYQSSEDDTVEVLAGASSLSSGTDNMGVAQPEEVTEKTQSETPPEGGPTSSPTSGAAAHLGPETEKCPPTRDASEDQYYVYQAEDSQWVFLHPLDLKCLLRHHGSYSRCPLTVRGKVLELVDVVQTYDTRKRWKSLSHLPLSGAFRLCELDMSEILPPEALEPFSHEIQQRERRRERMREEEERLAQEEAEAAKKLAAARQGPTAEELRAMPRLTGLDEEDLADSLALQESYDQAHLDGIPLGVSPPGGVSFAKIAKLGYAATGPALGSSPVSVPGASPAPALQGAWVGRGSAGKSTDAGPSLAAQLVLASKDGGSTKGPEGPLGKARVAAESPDGPCSVGKQKGRKGMLVLSSSSRRYQ